jgi:hypothetical protein
VITYIVTDLTQQPRQLTSLPNLAIFFPYSEGGGFSGAADLQLEDLRLYTRYICYIIFMFYDSTLFEGELESILWGSVSRAHRYTSSGTAKVDLCICAATLWSVCPYLYIRGARSPVPNA